MLIKSMQYSEFSLFYCSFTLLLNTSLKWREYYQLSVKEMQMLQKNNGNKQGKILFLEKSEQF